MKSFTVKYDTFLRAYNVGGVGKPVNWFKRFFSFLIQRINPLVNQRNKVITNQGFLCSV